MCILFLYQNNSEDSHYKLILAANRDEILTRPTKPADFLPDYPGVLCGLDLERGNNGTWLGINKSGKFAALTNVLVHYQQDADKLSRGHIIMDYLKQQDTSIEYMKMLESKNFREYNLLAGAVDSNGKITTAFYSNCDGEAPRLITDDVITVGCTSLNGNWKKMNRGQQIFQDLLVDLKNCSDSKLVTETLLDSLLSDTMCLYPDPNVKRQCKDRLSDTILEKYCSVKISGLPNYGTRIQTVVLIDKNNKVHFLEKSLIHATGPEYLEKSYTFDMEF